MQVIEQAGKTIILNSGFKLSFEPLTQLTEEWRNATLGEEHDERLRIVLPIDQNMRGVNMIDPLSVEPLSVYWARRKTQDAEGDECEVVQISTRVRARTRLLERRSAWFGSALFPARL